MVWLVLRKILVLLATLSSTVKQKGHSLIPDLTLLYCDVAPTIIKLECRHEGKRKTYSSSPSASWFILSLICLNCPNTLSSSQAIDSQRGLSAEALPVKLFICSWSSCLLYFPSISVTMAYKEGQMVKILLLITIISQDNYTLLYLSGPISWDLPRQNILDKSSTLSINNNLNFFFIGLQVYMEILKKV